MYLTWSALVLQFTRQATLLATPPSNNGFVDPRIQDGSMVDYTLVTEAGEILGEPLNVIISNRSDPYILNEYPGFHAYAKSLGFSEECLGLHYGNIHDADLGDGNGKQPEQFLARQFYFGPILGTCWESALGGNHFRAWKQNGTDNPTNAWFLGASLELDGNKHHMIADNGYDIGRDLIVYRATNGTRWRGMWWRADVEWQTGLLLSGTEGINHNISIDGRVAVLTVHRQ